MNTLNIEQMENLEGGMPCWAATAGLLAAGISFTFFTAGWGTLALNALGLGLADWGYLESCYPGWFE